MLGFKLLKSAHLNVRDVQLIKATITNITYKEIKTKIKSIYLDNEKPSSGENDVIPKSEPTFYTKQEDMEQQHDHAEFYDSEDEQAEDTFYTPSRWKNSNRRPQRQTNSPRSFPPFLPPTTGVPNQPLDAQLLLQHCSQPDPREETEKTQKARPPAVTTVSQ